MLKKIIAMGLITIMGIMLFSGCNGSKLIEEDADFFELVGWNEYISYCPNRIESTYNEPGTRLVLNADKGEFYAGDNIDFQMATLKYGEMAAWRITKDEVLDTAYIDVFVKVKLRIIGYAVIKITNPEGTLPYKAEIIKSVIFPKVNGEYQKVTQKQVNKKIAAAKK